MSQPAPRIVIQSEPSLTNGHVLALCGQRYAVSTKRGEVRAEPAAGCLLKPEPGDLVLLSLDGADIFILSVLRRALGREDAEMDFPGALALRTRGDIRLLADGDLSAAASRSMTFYAETAEAHFGEATLVSRVARATAKTLAVMAEAMETVAASLTQRLKNSVRLVEEHEEVQAGSSRLLVENTLTVHAKNALHVAEDVVKIDAGQVHLG
jgi:hypothetical protein